MSHRCPNCGYCPCCGRGARPYVRPLEWVVPQWTVVPPCYTTVGTGSVRQAQGFIANQ